MNIVLSDICVYPVKALAGISVQTTVIEPAGLAGDRRWVIIGADGRFISQRTHPRLAVVQAQPVPDGLLLTAEGLPPLRVAAPSGQARVTVSIWRDEVSAAVVPEADLWFSTLLAEPCRLAWMDDLCRRPVSQSAGQPEGVVSFADGFPGLIVSEASLVDLNSRLAVPVPMNRFRPNLVVAGCAAFDEDGWTRIAIGAAVLRAVKPCARCSATTVDQATGQSAAPEPLRTLAQYRQTEQGVLFGVNLVVERPGQVSCGDPVQILD